MTNKKLTFQLFSELNKTRCESANGFNHSLDSWTMSDWMVATLGELGEAANIVKKLNRYRDNIPGNKETSRELRLKLKSEIADTFIYLDLFAQSLGYSLEQIVVETWDNKSKQIGYPILINNKVV